MVQDPNHPPAVPPACSGGADGTATREQGDAATLARCRDELRALYDHAPVLLCVVGEDRIVQYANRAFTDFTGREAAALEGGRACGIFGCINALEDPRGCGFGHACGTCALRLALDDTLQGGGSHRDVPYHSWFESAGARREVFLLGTTAPIGGEGPPRALLCLYDISEQKRTEEGLRESEARSRLLVESSPIGIYVQTEARFVYLNAAALGLFGAREAADLLGRPVVEAFHPDDREKVRQRIALSNERKLSAVRAEERVLRQDGEVLVCEVSAVPLRYGGKDGALVFLADITARKRAEEERERLQGQLMQAQKMESVGRLAGGVAHDFNNMLGVILGHVELALDETPPSHPLHADLVGIRKAAERSADLTRQLLAFARKQTIAPRVLDLNETVAATLKMLRRLIGEEIDLRWQPGAGLDPVRVDPSQIDQVLANLCVNARDAIAGVGRITIATEKVSFDADADALQAGIASGDFVRLAVSDDGCGMDRETLGKLFEPFFTTKEVGQGTGLGLATVYGIVKQNDGFIDVESAPGEGTTFRIYLPSHRSGVAAARPAAAPAAATGRETVLVVEDEPEMLRIVTLMLRRQGYTVLAAATPGEALRLAGEHPGIDLLLTDVIMPEMNGRALAERLHGQHPQLRCLFMSGYTADAIAHHGVLDEGVHFLPKPFSVRELAARVREALGQGGEAP